MRDEGVTRSYIEFKRGLTRLVRRFIDNPIDVEDIVHEAYVRSLIASRKQKIESPNAYIAMSARNLALNHIASARAAHQENSGDSDFPDDKTDEFSMEERLETSRNLEAYCQAIEQLPVQSRRVFTLKQVYGLTQKEISQRLKISEKTVEYHVSKGLLHCRRALKVMRADGELPTPMTQAGVRKS